MVLRYAFENPRNNPPIRFGDFKQPKTKVLRRGRREKGSMMFEPHEILAVLRVAPVQFKAMTLLGINCGL